MATLTGGTEGLVLGLGLQALEDGLSPGYEIFVSRGDIRGGIPPALVPSPVFVIRVFPDRQDNGSR